LGWVVGGGWQIAKNIKIIGTIKFELGGGNNLTPGSYKSSYPIYSG
jgi:hypothetical protein